MAVPSVIVLLLPRPLSSKHMPADSPTRPWWWTLTQSDFLLPRVVFLRSLFLSHLSLELCLPITYPVMSDLLSQLRA